MKVTFNETVSYEGGGFGSLKSASVVPLPIIKFQRQQPNGIDIQEADDPLASNGDASKEELTQILRIPTSNTISHN